MVKRKLIKDKEFTMATGPAKDMHPPLLLSLQEVFDIDEKKKVNFVIRVLEGYHVGITEEFR